MLIYRIKLQTQSAKEKAEILGIMARMDQEFQDTEADAKHEYSSTKDDVKNKNLEEKHALRIQLEGAVEDLWRQFQAALNLYNSSTEERKKQFEDLKQKDQKNAKEIELQMKKLMKLQVGFHFSFFISTNNCNHVGNNRKLQNATLEQRQRLRAQKQSSQRRERSNPRSFPSPQKENEHHA